MDYETFQPHPDLAPFVKCYWTLEVPSATESQRQRIIPDGCIEMAFILGDDIKRYTSGDTFILQPRAMVLGQTLEPFYIEPTGYVNTFAIRFCPYGFANFVSVQIASLANTETPLDILFGEKPARELERRIVEAPTASARIAIIERFLLQKLTDRVTVDRIVKETVDALTASRGSQPINSIINDSSKRRQLERKFRKQIGISPKQLGKVVRLQAALRLLCSGGKDSLTSIAYESEYYDQAHFIKDFKEFTGTSPKEFLGHESHLLSSLFYSRD
jgi:hypothetical protein